MSDKDKRKDPVSFSSFALGATIGAGAALLFGTKEGREIAHKVLDMIPDSVKEHLPGAEKDSTPDFVPPVTPTETPHATTFKPKSDVEDVPVKDYLLPKK